MAQLVAPLSVPPIARRPVAKLDAIGAVAALGDMAQHHDRFVVRLSELLARIAVLDATDPALAGALRESVYWNATFSLDEVAGALHAVECAVAEVDVCLRIGTELGLDALLDALGYEEVE